MFHSKPRNLFALIAIAGLTATSSFERGSESQTAQSYIVQANGLDQAMALVSDVGGKVTHELGIIRAVGATLLPAQVEVAIGNNGCRFTHVRRPGHHRWGPP